jgi:ankyrin repeat protein
MLGWLVVGTVVGQCLGVFPAKELGQSVLHGENSLPVEQDSNTYKERGGSTRSDGSHSGAHMYSQIASRDQLDRLVQLAVQRGDNREAFLSRLESSGLGEVDSELLFAWYREMPGMADHNDLLLAARLHYDELAQKLLSTGADPNRRTTDGTSALIYASQLGDVALVRALLHAGADPNVKTTVGDSALLSAAKRGDFETVKLLIAGGADPRIASTDGFTPLMAGATVGNAALVRLLLERGANPRDRNRDGWSTLVFGAVGGSVEVGRLLIDDSADVDAQSSDKGWSPLLKATERRCHDFMQLLIQHGANVDARTKDGKTALILAAGEDQEMSPGDLRAVEILLAAGAKPNIADKSGSTPLMISAQYGGPDIVRTLLEHGADPNLTNNMGRTALEIALESRHYAVADLLRMAGTRE